jgi:hypothetical protein
LLVAALASSSQELWHLFVAGVQLRSLIHIHPAVWLRRVLRIL